MDEKEVALMDFLLDARKLSTWGPDFKDERTLVVWVKKLSKYDNEILSKAIDSLSGKKEFPAPADIIEFATSLLGRRQNVTAKIDEDPRRTLVKNILRTDEMKDLKKVRLEFFYHVQEDLLIEHRHSVEDLEYYFEHTGEMITKIAPNSQGFNSIDSSKRIKEPLSLAGLVKLSPQFSSPCSDKTLGGSGDEKDYYGNISHPEY